ncbi:MAG TPA: CBS domain-containing protein [Pirellulaceae bacterium]|jgi:acetoin utilization protein AcuB
MQPRVFAKLHNDQNGATSTEYAIIMALIAGAILLGADAMRFMADGAFRRSALALGSPAAAVSPRLDSVNRPVANPEALPLFSAAFPPMHAFAWGVLIAAVALVGHSCYRKWHARRAVKEIDCQTEIAPETPTNPNFKKRQDIQRVLLRNFDDVLHSRIETRHVMSRKVRAVEPTTLVSDLKSLMETEGFHHLLVMRKDKLLGIISDRDIANRKGRRAADIMTAQPKTIFPDTLLSHAITLALHWRISCVPVVENDQVKGILTSTDMLMTLQCLMQILERANAESAASPSSGVVLPASAQSMPEAVTTPLVC